MSVAPSSHRLLHMGTCPSRSAQHRGRAYAPWHSLTMVRLPIILTITRHPTRRRPCNPSLSRLTYIVLIISSIHIIIFHCIRIKDLDQQSLAWTTHYISYISYHNLYFASLYKFVTVFIVLAMLYTHFLIEHESSTTTTSIYIMLYILSYKCLLMKNFHI